MIPQIWYDIVCAHMDYITSTVNDTDSKLDSLIAPCENAVRFMPAKPVDYEFSQGMISVRIAFLFLHL